MLIDTLDPLLVNGWANHAQIRPELSGTGRLDLSAGVLRPNVFLFGKHGGFCFTWSAPGTFEVHVMIDRAGRGRWGIEAGKYAIAVMAARGMEHLWGRIHPERREMAVYARACGLCDTWETHTLDAGDGPVAWRIFNWRM